MSAEANSHTSSNHAWRIPVAVKSRGRYRIWLRYDDGEEGEVDLSHLSGKGVFKVWDVGQGEVFDQVFIHAAGFVSWPDEIDLDSDVLYSKITRRPITDVVTWAEAG